jgi:hypothetical protein
MARQKYAFRATCECQNNVISLSSRELQQLISLRQVSKPQNTYKISSGPANNTPKNVIKKLQRLWTKTV